MNAKEIYRLTIKLFLIYFLIKQTIRVLNILTTYLFDKNITRIDDIQYILLLNLFYLFMLLLLYYRDNLFKIFPWNSKTENSQISIQGLTKRDLVEFAVLFVGLNLLLYPIPEFVYNFYLIIKPYFDSELKNTTYIYTYQKVWMSALSILFGYIIISNLDKIARLLLKSNDE